ncbi:hypothetical protein [Flavihumibacter petaseus]|nr:hypothetical protein [Flavihumibacter petaseus]
MKELTTAQTFWHDVEMIVLPFLLGCLMTTVIAVVLYIRRRQSGF